MRSIGEWLYQSIPYNEPVTDDKITIQPTGAAGAWDASLRRDETEDMEDIEVAQRDDGQWIEQLDGEVVTVQPSRGEALDQARLKKERSNE